MKKWIVVVVLILILLINPSKFSIFKNSDTLGKDLKEVKTININDNSQYITYKNNLILFNDNKLTSIDEKGKIIFELNMNVDDYKLSEGKYIDFFNKSKNTVLSINENGKFIFKENVPPETILYKSIDEYNFLTVYKKDNNEYIKIQDEQGNVKKTFKYNGKITNVEDLGRDILISNIETDDKIKSRIDLYDENGNEKKSIEFEGIILEVFVTKKYIYVVFDNNITVLNQDLSEESEIKIDKIINVYNYGNGYIYIKDGNGNVGYIDKTSYKKIDNKGKNIVPIGKSYINYSEDTIFNEYGSKIITFKKKINNILVVNNNTVAIVFDNNIKIVSI